MAIKQHLVNENSASKSSFEPEANSIEYAKTQDLKDPLSALRNEFVIPSVTDLKRKQLRSNGMQ